MKIEMMNKLEAIVGPVITSKVLEHQGCTSTVRLIVTENCQYIVKTSTESKYREWLSKEADNLRLIQQVIPVPQFYGFIEEPEASHLVMSFEEGVSLTIALKQASLEEKKKLLRSFGQFLQRLHELPPVQSIEQSENWLDQQLERAKVYVTQGDCDGSPELLEELILNKPAPIKQTMIHGDCTADNVLVADGEVYKFIDVAGMTWGDPRYDAALAVRKIYNEPELLDAFYEGYTRHKITKEQFRYFYHGLYAFF